MSMQLSTLPCSRPNQEGFTLIELSIVLVIIGLIVGGVLTGQDLIKAAELRSTLGQIEKYNTAVNTFRAKYGGIPGDLLSANSFGFTVAGSGAAGHGDGNGLLEGCSAGSLTAGCETALFWYHLTEASLIDGSYIAATDAATAAASTTIVATFFPAAKVGRGNYITTFSTAGLNYFSIVGISSIAAGAYTLTTALTPAESYNMDKKIDDGKPLSGVVSATEGTAALNVTAVAGAATCVFTGGTSYNMTTPTLASTPLCQVRMRFN